MPRMFVRSIVVPLFGLLSGGAPLAGTVADAAPQAATWTIVAHPPGTLNAVTSLAPSDVWAAGYSIDQQVGAFRALTVHWNGTVWTAVLPPPGSAGDNVLSAVSGAAANDVWAVGYQARRFQSYPTRPLAEHWNGSRWSVVRTPSVTGSGALHGVVAIASNDAWAVGELGTSDGPLIERFDGVSWQAFPSPDLPGFAELDAVAARSASDIWAVGSYRDGAGITATLTEHFDGVAWSVVASPNADEYNQLTGVALDTGGSGAWASGNRNPEFGYFTLTERYDGASWTISDAPDVGRPNNELNAVTALRNGAAYTAGYQSEVSIGPLIERWDGSAWSVDSIPSTPFGALLWGITSSSDNTVWAVGDNLIMRRQG